jgi:hypothetical protein
VSILERRLSKLEDADNRGRPRFLWLEPGMSDADIEAEIERRRTAGTLDDLDELIFVRWKAVDNRTHEDCLDELAAHESQQ